MSPARKKITNKRLAKAKKKSVSAPPLKFKNHYLMRLVRHIKGLLSALPASRRKKEITRQLDFLADFIHMELVDGDNVQKRAQRLTDNQAGVRELQRHLKEFLRAELL